MKINKLKKYMKNEMLKIIDFNDRQLKGKKIKDLKFGFCWGQAKFDTLMDIDRTLKLGVFYKKKGRIRWS